MDHDLDTILSHTTKGSSSADKVPATGSSTISGCKYPKVDRTYSMKTSNAKGTTPMERFEAENFGDGPWHDVKDVHMPTK
ncbi:hypothetical protein QBC45DRAFT_422583 [Copromyces sp. CBS 386.78]|nr:hypothetical protein QBC45DRAFT_422583 [Copromyces sp. CBS 386.78]